MVTCLGWEEYADYVSQLYFELWSVLCNFFFFFAKAAVLKKLLLKCKNVQMLNLVSLLLKRYKLSAQF